MRRLSLVAFAILWALWPAAAGAAVRIQFYSHEFGREFPHAFVLLKGTLDETGEAVETDLGFSAVSLTPVLFAKSVKGVVQTNRVDADYIRRSREQFAFTLTDQEYREVLAVAEAWRTRAQPTYNINSANCVHFVAEIARVLKLKADPVSGLMKSPKLFLERVKADSQTLIAQRLAPPPVLEAAASAPLVTGRELQLETAP